MTLIDMLKGDAEGVYHATASLFKLVDESALDWKPETGKNWMTTGQLVMHCTNACGSIVKGFVTGDWGLPEGVEFKDIPPEQMMPPAESMDTVKSIAEAHELLEEDKKVAIEMFEKAGEERLANEMSAPPWGGPEATLFQHCRSMISHLETHKAQLFYYLKLQGKDVNTMTLYGMGPGV